ncbi:MAG TPA: PilT/PilU family type 4a pilus ATPase [Vicinamibacterales bacterium]|nr:PilT/PilU family type 4a pilus ATPase [Vicinamibacterales bacterium]
MIDDINDDIDALIDELNATGAVGVRPGPRALRLQPLLAEVARRRGSDLLLVAGSAPGIRIDGAVARLDGPVLDGADIEELVIPVLPSRAARQYRETGSADASLSFTELGRFRANLHSERGRAAAAIRVLPARVPKLSDLALPPEVAALSSLGRGLVLIGGATGAGKTTTMAALIDDINRRDAKHIITVEDPIEYEHQHERSLVEQVEIGQDAPDFPAALRSAVRQAPDVLVIGEMRDPESMRIALSAAETGHLVLSSLHTTDIASTIGRMCDSFPNERQNTIRQELSLALSAVLTQTLVPRTGGGRVPAAELLMVSYGARQHIRKNALQHLHQEMSLTRKQGSVTLEDSLARLVKAGLITAADAMARAGHPDELESILRA